jgi:hypothetical protein
MRVPAYLLFVSVFATDRIPTPEKFDEDTEFETAAYFTPSDPSLFQQWRNERLQMAKPDLVPLTDPSKRSRKQIFSSLLMSIIDDATILHLRESCQPPASLEPVLRGIISLRILSDLGLLVGDAATGADFNWIAHGLASLPEQTPAAHAMTFSMAVVRCAPAWNTIKSIAADHEVPPANLSRAMGLLGSHLGARWLYRILGLNIINVPPNVQMNAGEQPAIFV